MRLLLSFLVLSSYYSFAQNLVMDSVKINFRTKTITYQPSKSCLQKADYVQIRIDSIPMNNYLVTIGKKDSIITLGTPPALFSALNFGDSYTKLLTNLADFSVGIVSSKTGDVKKVTENIIPSSVLGEMQMMAMESYNLTDENSEVAIAIHSLTDTMTTMRHHLFTAYYNFKDAVIDPTDTLSLNYNLNLIPNCSTFSAQVNQILRNRNLLSRALDSMYLYYHDFILPRYDILAQSIPLLKADSMIQRYRKDFFIFLGKFDSTFNRSLISKTCAVLNAPAPVTRFVSLPYPVRGKDINTFSIKITPLDTSKSKQPFETEIPLYHYPNRFWAFTSGVYLSGFLSSEQYSFRANTQPQLGTNPIKYDTLGYTLLADKKDKVQAGISALLHVGSYSDNNNWGWHFALGPGLSMESKPRPRIVVGGGLIFGRNDKITFTVGWIGGPVKTLKTAYQANGNYQGAPSDIMKDSFKSGFALSLGYALFGK